MVKLPGEIKRKALELAIGELALPDEQIVSPQSTGDLIGRAVRVYRANIRQWAPLLLWPTVCVLVGRVIYQASAAYFQQDQSQVVIVVPLILGFTVVIMGKWFLLQKQLAFVRLTTGFSKTLDEAMTYTKRRKWAIAGVVALCLIIFTGVFMLWMLEIIAAGVLTKIIPVPAVIAMVLGFIGFIISSAFIMFALLLSLSALACENGTVTSLLSRGFTLSSKSFFRTLWCGLIASLTVNLIATPMWLPISLIGSLDALRAGGTLQGLPMYWQVTIAAWETLIEMVTQPILFLAYGFYYYDLRLRYEGVDVLEALETIKLKQRALLE
jgi:hypothetical protein